MRMMTILLTAILLGTGPLGTASADTITFNAASPPISKFKIKRMIAKGIENPQPAPGVSLSGDLLLPDGDGPFPAVVLSHDCRGIRNHQKAFAQRLTDWGYAALLIDTYGPRGIEPGSVCANLAKWDTRDFIGGRTLDIYGALRFLADHPQVDSARVALLGWDRDSTLSAVAVQGVQATFPDLKPVTAVAITPDCRRFSSGNFASPVLIIAASEDDWWPAANCAKLKAASEAGDGATVTLETLDASHGFGDTEIGEGTTIAVYNPNAEKPEATFAYSAAAAKEAETAIRAFLDKTMM